MNPDSEIIKREPLYADVMLALQKGLLGEVTPSLRSVDVRFVQSGLHCRAYFDGEPSEEEREGMSRLETQLYADMPVGFEITLEVLR